MFATDIGTGSIWRVFPDGTGAAQIITGQTSGYVRRDLTPFLTTHFCSWCGVVTHWSPLPHARQNRMGVNMRLFPSEALAGLETSHHDGSSWPLT